MCPLCLSVCRRKKEADKKLKRKESSISLQCFVAGIIRSPCSETFSCLFFLPLFFLSHFLCLEVHLQRQSIINWYQNLKGIAGMHFVVPAALVLLFFCTALSQLICFHLSFSCFSLQYKGEYRIPNGYHFSPTSFVIICAQLSRSLALSLRPQFLVVFDFFFPSVYAEAPIRFRFSFDSHSICFQLFYWISSSFFLERETRKHVCIFRTFGSVRKLLFQNFNEIKRRTRRFIAQFCLCVQCTLRTFPSAIQ